MQNDDIAILIARLDEREWAMFGGDRKKGCQKISKAIADLAAWPAAKNLAAARKDLGVPVPPGYLEGPRKKALAAAAFLRAVHRKCGLSAPYPEEWTKLEKALYDERHEALRR